MGDADLPIQPEPRGDVTFAGGEPTLDPSLTDRVRDAVARGATSVLVQTNGRRLAYASYLEELVDAGVTHLDISLHGPTPVVHDYHTGVPGSFVQTAKGIHGAARTRLVVGVTTVVTRSNFRHLPAMADLLRRLGARSWHISAARPIGAAAADISAVVPRLGMLHEPLAVAIARSSAGGLPVATTGIPACIAVGSVRTRLDRVPPAGPRPEPCTTCLAAGECAGAGEEYPAHFAEADLTPFTDVRALLTARAAEGPPARFGGIGATPFRA